MWNKLSMKDRAEYIKLGVANGITSLDEIKDVYNKYADGGYIEYMEKLAKKKAKDWNEDEDIVLTTMLNDNTYDYKDMYNSDKELALKMLKEGEDSHFPDTYKTVYHPTFSNESKYSGKISERNPRGTIGGRWENDLGIYKYHPSYSQYKNKDFDYNKTKKYLERGDERIDNYYENLQNNLQKTGELQNYATLTTDYPIISRSAPYTGHSSLSIFGILPNTKGDVGIYSLGISKGGHNFDYNLLTNNCSDATREGLEYAFGKKINPFLFTTPGDVQDFALEELGGIPGTKNDSIFNPKIGKYVLDKRSDKIKKANRGTSTVYIPINKNQKEKLLEYIIKGDIEKRYAEGGELDEGGYTKESINERKAIHKRYDPAGGLGPITQGLYMLSGGNQSKGEENEYWKAYLGLSNSVPRMDPKAKTSWDDKIEKEKIENGEMPSDFYGTTPRMDLNIQSIADTLNVGKIYRNYNNYKERYPELPEKDFIETIYKTGKRVLENPNTWQQIDGDATAIKKVLEDDTNEMSPLGMLANFGMMWKPEEKAIYMHDTYDFPTFSRLFVGNRPKEMKIRSRINFDPRKGSKLLRNNMKDFYNYPEPLVD